MWPDVALARPVLSAVSSTLRQIRVGDPARKGNGAFRRPAETIWGDGFDEDGWAELARVDDWSRCSPDEYLRIFPQLVSRDGVCPAVLRVHLEECVAARAWRLRFVGESLEAEVRSP